MKLVQIDPNLGKMQAQLTKTVNEEDFWTNYFYHVHLIKVDEECVGYKLQRSLTYALFMFHFMVVQLELGFMPSNAGKSLTKPETSGLFLH